MSSSSRRKKQPDSSAAAATDSSSRCWDKHFLDIEERPVDDIRLEFFYKPRTITWLIICILILTFSAFYRDASQDYRSNIFTGICGATLFFVVISVLAFPNGPFIRPHPSLWRMVFGLSIIYLLVIQFLIFQDYATVRAIIVWFDPKMAEYSIDKEKEYGTNCWDITLERLWSHVDWFAFGHYWGWGMKALILRSYGLCWSISIMWELTEFFFGHLLPNFYECWWDNFVLDVLICNGLGIFTGMQVCRWFEMREHHWESVKDIRSKKGKVKRMLLQFTPESWTPTRWMDPHCGWMRFLAIAQFMVIWQSVELNTFFVKHIFPMPTEHPLCVFRILLIGLISAPATRQYYTYVTDPQCKRLGTQAWIFVTITLSELILNVKFGRDLFSQTQMIKVVMWLITNILISCMGTYISWRFKTKWAAEAKAAAANGNHTKTAQEHSEAASSPATGGAMTLRKRPQPIDKTYANL